MAFVTALDFERDILIPQISQQAVLERVNKYISIYEPEYLKTILGYEFYKQFMAGLSVDPPNQKWIDLRDGADFTNAITNKLEQYTGIAKPAANYIYYYLRRDSASLTTPAGDVVNRTENSAVVSSGRKMVNAWNAMVDYGMNLYKFLYANKDVYQLDESFFYRCDSIFSKQNDFDL